jgi:3-oxoacyl-[acyl-carrier-protein] synthase III
MLRSRITGLGRFVPERVVTNKDLEEVLQTTDEWILQRTGIRERHWVTGDVGSADLALPAARQALAAAGLEATDLDFVLVATLSPDITFPGTSCLLQAKLGCPGVAILDIRNQCTGFLYGLTIADQFIRTGMMKRILVVGTEVHSSGLEMSPRGREVTVLFGDGAGAAVVEATEGPAHILGSCLHGDGRYAELLHLVAPASNRNPRLTHEMIDQGLHFPRMDGRAVFRHAVEEMPAVILEVLGRYGYTLADIDLFVPHQANQKINDFVARKLAIPAEKMVCNIERYGNTTAASIPIALSESQEQGRLEAGQLVLLAAFGAGLTWGATLIRW